MSHRKHADITAAAGRRWDPTVDRVGEVSKQRIFTAGDVPVKIRSELMPPEDGTPLVRIAIGTDAPVRLEVEVIPGPAVYEEL